MKADKRAKIELRMENLGKESIEWQERESAYADKLNDWERTVHRYRFSARLSK